jgi:Protein of unknown function (DUF2778)
MFEYHQISGEMLQDGKHVAFGYSGKGEGRNNPAYQQVRCVGPIPAGLWTISGPPLDTDQHGPFVLHVDAAEGTNTFGRSGFLVHGDSKVSPGMASEGCIVMPRNAREQIWASGDRDLQVIA